MEWEWEEGKKEEGILDHWSHKHPLCLVEASRDEEISTCCGCIRSISIRNEERMYVCSKRCGSGIAFHEECAEIPRKIKHPFHHQHILMIQEHLDLDDHECVFCKRDIEEKMSYSCTSSKCHSYFHMHLRCAQAWGSMDAAAADDDVVMHHHRSHPRHELMFVRRSAGGSHSFKCDACGTKQRGDSYLCTVCSQFWIHQKCASLPDSVATAYHHHPLSLSFRFPRKYIHYDTACTICLIPFNPKYWIYHCQLCKFAVHISCAFKQVDVRYPINDVVKERITPFVEALIRGKIAGFPDKIIGNVNYEVPFHKHKLSLISPPPSELICDGCITPILSHWKQNKYILSCSECKYILHWACSQLPPQLPSLPLHNHHEVVLESCSKLEFGAKCHVCELCTNGLMYACTSTTCDFKADIKCAVLPDSIYHEGHHEQHLLTHFSKEEMKGEFTFNLAGVMCGAAGCGESPEDFDCFVCSTCDFSMHVRCAVLPETIKERNWDKHNHHLVLTYASATTPNDINDIYCDCCEQVISPKEWVYRCDSCDLSFHPRCFPALSGEYRNIKFGQQYTIAAAHPHPLAYQFLTIKRRCDICRRNAYGLRGFQCASCNFFICFDMCAQPLLQDARIQIVDES